MNRVEERLASHCLCPLDCGGTGSAGSYIDRQPQFEVLLLLILSIVCLVDVHDCVQGAAHVAHKHVYGYVHRYGV